MMSYVASALIPTLHLCRRMKPNVIHCHFAVPTGLLALMVYWATGVPYALTVHGSDLPGHNTTRFKFAHRFTPPILRRVLSNASKIVSPSHFLAEHLHSTCGPYNVEVIPNGIDFRRFNAMNPNRKAAILMSGRLLESKRFAEAFEALSKIPGDYEIHVAGDGPMRERMEAIAREMPQKVAFHGWLDGSSSQLKKLYETCSIFALPSDRENAPVSLLEAMAAGMAIVTSDGSGCRETADDCGVLAPPRDIEALRSAFSGLLNNPERVKKLGRAARTRVETCFDEDMLAARYIALLTEVAKRRKRNE
jgi:glycosyltransferase involved in cell wall biosynthesis